MLETRNSLIWDITHAYKGGSIPKPPKPPLPPAKNEAGSLANEQMKKLRGRRGFQETILTGGSGASGTPELGRKTLLGQ